MPLFWSTVAAGIACITICRFISGKWVTPALLYWAHWCLAALTCWYCADQAWLPEITDYGLFLIESAHLGAFPGFIIGSVVGAALVLPRPAGQTQVMQLTTPGMRKWARRLTYFLLFVAMVHLVYRMARVGISGSFYYDSRMDFLDKDKGFTRITFYITPLMTVIATYAGATARLGSSDRRLMWVLFAAIFVNSLASGSRSSLFAAALYYMFGFFMVDAPKHLRRFNLREFVGRYRRQLTTLAVLVIIFQALGAWRVSPETEHSTAPDTWLPAQFIAYIALPAAALGPLADLLPGDTTDGQMLFPFAAKWAYRFGFLKELAVGHEVYDRETLRQIDWRISWSQATAIIAMVADYGDNAVPWVTGILMAIGQMLFLIFRRAGVVGITIGALMMMACFLVAQDPFFINGAVFLAIIWAMFLGYAGRAPRRVRVVPDGPPLIGPGPGRHAA